MDVQRFLQLALHELESGAPAKCFEICNEILAAEPGLIQAMYLRGCSAYDLGDVGQSLDDLQVVHTNHPEHLHAAYFLGRSLRAAGRFEEALAPLHSALAAGEFAVRARYELATCLGNLRHRPEAIEVYLELLALQPDHVQAAANLASLLERENRLEEAGVWAGKVLSIDPANQTARMTRAVVDRRSGNAAEAARQLQDLIPTIDNPVNECIAWNQLGQCLEDLEEWRPAFDAYGNSNRVLRDRHPGATPDPKGPHGMDTLGTIRAWLAQEPIREWQAASEADSGGIVFLVGFPRSGTTLLDRMLRAHPDVEVLEEKSLFAPLHQDWSQAGVLEALGDINEEQIYDGRRIYRDAMALHRQDPARSLVVDKLPLNLACLFLVNRLFPEAPILFLQRHPADACISCYFQAFELGASMGYFLDLENTARYYDAVMQVASSSMQQISNPLHSLRYEDLVAEPDEQLRALCDFLGIEFVDAMLADRSQAGGSSDTPSYQQVSQPLYTRSIGRWRHYVTQLEPVMPLLQPWVGQLAYE